MSRLDRRKTHSSGCQFLSAVTCFCPFTVCNPRADADDLCLFKQATVDACGGYCGEAVTRCERQRQRQSDRDRVTERHTSGDLPGMIVDRLRPLSLRVRPSA